MTPLIYFFLCAAAAAGVGCDLKGFDQTPPPALRSIVNNRLTGARFEWASDVDIVGGKSRIWNYIWNLGQAGLPAKWVKGNIWPSTHFPIPVGEAFCYRNLIEAPIPDKNAPILYGKNQASGECCTEREDAAVYVEQRVAQAAQNPDTSSIVDTTISDDDGKPRPVYIEISTTRTPKGILLDVIKSPENLVIGVSNLLSGLDNAQAAVVRSRLGSVRIGVQEGSLAEYAGRENLSGVFDANELKEREGTRYVFLSGNPKAIVEIEGAAFEKKATEMVVFDRNRKPLLVAGVNMLLPTK